MAAKVLEFRRPKPGKPANASQRALNSAIIVAPFIGHFIFGWSWPVVIVGSIIAMLAIWKFKL